MYVKTQFEKDSLIVRYEHELVWLKNKIEELKLKLDKKPSTSKQIKDLQRQIRQTEVFIAFI